MSEFARILSEIIDHGRKNRLFKIKELAQRADITASYLSNMKQGNKNPPAQKTLGKLADALRQSSVSETDIQRLIDAYSREPLKSQEEGLIESLINGYIKKNSLFERVRQGVQTKGAVLKAHADTDHRTIPENLSNELIEGDHQTLLLKEIDLLKYAKARNMEGGHIYITWFHCASDARFEPLTEQLCDTIRGFLWVNSPFKVYHLWAGDVTRDATVIVNFLAQYIGTSDCFLYDIPASQHFPEYLVIEDIGFIEARPTSEDHYWIRTVLTGEPEHAQSDELSVVIEYLEYLSGLKDSRSPLVQTEASPRKYASTASLKIFAEAERSSIGKERLQLKTTFSSTYRDEEQLRPMLEILYHDQDESLESFLAIYHQRVEALQSRIKHGKERTIHERRALRERFCKTFLKKPYPDNEVNDKILTAEYELLKGQIINVLKAIQQNPHIHFGLIEQEIPFKFKLAGNVASFAFAQPRTQEVAYDQKKLVMIAWTRHPDLIYRLQNEFDANWQDIDVRWRTDSEDGRRHVVNFIVAEALKAMLNADIPSQELWQFMWSLVDATNYLDAEAFKTEIYHQEQAARNIFILCESLPIILMPVSVGPWPSRDPIRTRQRLLYAILREIKSFRVFSTQLSLEHYWTTNTFGRHQFSGEWTTQHFRYVHDLFLESGQKVSMEILPSPEQFLVNVEIIDQESVFIEKSGTNRPEDEGGIMIQDKELARDFIAYVERNLSTKCPENLKSARNVAKWFEERFGMKK